MRKKILIVDDSADYLLITKRVFRDFDFAILLAESALEATQILSETHVDLMITDLNMPGMNGLELIQWCREQHGIQSVILSTSDNRKFYESDLRLGYGSAHVINKPFNLKSFRDRALDLMLCDNSRSYDGGANFI
ncbi:MAG: response regulator [Proteobacteria bacterium]|nr:MAG: response regulator [Pseudomonadota bacterium]